MRILSAGSTFIGRQVNTWEPLWGPSPFQKLFLHPTIICWGFSKHSCRHFYFYFLPFFSDFSSMPMPSTTNYMSITINNTYLYADFFLSSRNPYLQNTSNPTYTKVNSEVHTAPPTPFLHPTPLPKYTPFLVCSHSVNDTTTYQVCGWKTGTFLSFTLFLMQHLPPTSFTFIS